MLVFILKMIISFAGSEIGKQAIKLGAEKLVNALGNGIEDETINVFLENSVKSKRNKMTNEIKNSVLNQISNKIGN